MKTVKFPVPRLAQPRRPEPPAFNPKAYRLSLDERYLKSVERSRERATVGVEYHADKVGEAQQAGLSARAATHDKALIRARDTIKTADQAKLLYKGKLPMTDNGKYGNAVLRQLRDTYNVPFPTAFREAKEVKPVDGVNANDAARLIFERISKVA